MRKKERQTKIYNSEMSKGLPSSLPQQNDKNGVDLEQEIIYKLQQRKGSSAGLGLG